MLFAYCDWHFFRLILETHQEQYYLRRISLFINYHPDSLHTYQTAKQDKRGIPTKRYFCRSDDNSGIIFSTSIATDRVLFSSEKCWYLSYFLKKTCCGYSLEAPLWGAYNEYPQHMFSSKNKKNIMWIPPLVCSYAVLHKNMLWVLVRCNSMRCFKSVPTSHVFMEKLRDVSQNNHHFFSLTGFL